jgi:geranylgeranyl pyrophosphate synthase
LDEGTFTFPIIEGLNNPDVRSELLKMLQIRQKSREDKEAIIKLLTDCEAISQTKKRVLELIAEVRGLCDKFGENKLMDDFMSQFFIETL